MKMIPVESSNILEIGHQGNTLRVAFHNGKTYEYSPVSEDTFDLLKNAESVGRFFNTHIKGDNSIQFKQIG